MKHSGDLPVNSKRELDRVAVASMYGWTEDEIYTAAWTFKSLRNRQPDSTVTFRWYLDQMVKQGLRPSDMGKRRGQMQLSRYKDSGAYTPDNCRFLPSYENHAERDFSYMANAATRAKISRIAKSRVRFVCACGTHATPGMFARWHGQKCRRGKVT